MKRRSFLGLFAAVLAAPVAFLKGKPTVEVTKVFPEGGSLNEGLDADALNLNSLWVDVDGSPVPPGSDVTLFNHNDCPFTVKNVSRMVKA